MRPYAWLLTGALLLTGCNTEVTPPPTPEQRESERVGRAEDCLIGPGRHSNPCMGWEWITVPDGRKVFCITAWAARGDHIGGGVGVSIDCDWDTANKGER